MTDHITQNHRPTLILQTVYFHENDKTEAQRLGLDLYDALTRPTNDPLAFSTGIPVYCGVESEKVRLDAAEHVVIIPVLGTLTFQLQQKETVKQINDWHADPGLESGLILPVPVDTVWRSVENQLPGKQLLTELYEADDAENITLDEIVLSSLRLLDHDQQKPTLFISHAKADLKNTGKAARRIAYYVKSNTTGEAFFDRTELFAGEGLQWQIDQAVQNGVFVAVRGDSYSSRIWCQHELLCAKKAGLPTLTVEVLTSGEQRSLAYGGNGPTIVWQGDPSQITSRAMIEWLLAVHFKLEAQRMIKLANLPKTDILVRPPELLDLVQGPLQLGANSLVMYPDPELPAIERQVLRIANPRIRLTTPLTVFRRLLSQDNRSISAASLGGLRIGMSLSDSPDVNGPEGFTEYHVEDVTIQIARALISCGASIGYGGDFRKNGFTVLLAELIRAYNETTSEPRDFLHSYLGVPIQLGDIPRNTPMHLHHLATKTESSELPDQNHPDVTELAMIPSDLIGQDSLPAALYFSDMRQAMEKCIHSRIIIGGNAVPKSGNEKGYGGRYPGLVEEAWRCLQLKHPLYVIGGFGGAAALVAELIQTCDDDEIPVLLQDATWKDNNNFRELAKAIDENEHREKLGLPETMDELAFAVKNEAKSFFRDDESCLGWNGLTLAENHKLFTTRDPVLINSLVMQGLLNVHQTKAKDKLSIELVHGNVTNANELDAIAVATFDRIPLGGAGAAIDQLLGGLAKIERHEEGSSLINLNQNNEIDANWLLLSSMGPPCPPQEMSEAIRSAARETIKIIKRYGLQRLGLVTYGGNVFGNISEAAQLILEELKKLGNFTKVFWFETNNDHFNELQKLLEAQNSDILLTKSRVKSSRSQSQLTPESLLLNVSYEDESLKVTVLPPSGTAIAGFEQTTITSMKVKQLARGIGPRNRSTPTQETLEKNGQELAQILFGGKADDLLAKIPEAKIVIIHDVESSHIPFEMMRTEIAGTPAITSGISRRLAIRGVPVEELLARPPKAGLLNVLLVIDPSDNLPGAQQEGLAIETVLNSNNKIHLTVLHKDRELPTRQTFLNAISSADILHYCGHAFFDGPGENESGLILRDGNCTLADLRGRDVPRVAFVNACEAGRVRGNHINEAASFAEFFLRSGIEAYLGTYWEVGDNAAQTFAKEVYSQLISGNRLDEAVTQGRKILKQQNEADWANYLLYGDGRFQLVTPDHTTD